MASQRRFAGCTAHHWNSRVGVRFSGGCECLQCGIDSGEVRLDLPVDAMADAVTEIHLAYVERIVSGTESPNAERLSLDALECLLFGICLKDDSKTTPSQRRKRSR